MREPDYKDRVKIVNPGKLFGEIKIKDILLRKFSMRRKNGL